MKSNSCTPLEVFASERWVDGVSCVLYYRCDHVTKRPHTRVHTCYFLNLCINVCCLPIMVPKLPQHLPVRLITRPPLKLPRGTEPINYFDWSVKCPEEMETLCGNAAAESQYTPVAFLYSCPILLTFVWETTQRKFLLSTPLIFVKRKKSVWGDEIRKKFQTKASALFFTSFHLLLNGVKTANHGWHIQDFSMPSLWFQINARQWTKCSLQGEKD